ncbi:MAG: FxsA family protein [Actinomycetota bacterium]|nr:FxsA family protein [Actinomycetota bacterium]
MAGLLMILFLVVPIAELAVIVQVSDWIGGVLPTIALLIVVSIAGAWLVKREGLSAFVRVQRELERGEMPTKTLVDGLLILFGGALLLTPGFLTDGLGFLLLVPPTRAAVRTILIRRFRDRITTYGTDAGYGFGRSRVFHYGTVVDTGTVETDPSDGDDPDDPGPPRARLDP